MLGSLGKSWVAAVVAIVVIGGAGALLWTQFAGRGAAPGAEGQVLRVCLKDGTKFLGPADAKAPEAKCPKCGGETLLARVFRCPKGHIFLGFLEKPPDPNAAAGPDEYAKHVPRVLRPGIDKDFAPGRSPVCPVCKLGMERPITDLRSISFDDIKSGPLPAAGGGE